MQHLTNLDKSELRTSLAALNEKEFRANQIWSWVYARGLTSFSAMTNLGKSTQEKLAQHFSLPRPEISKDHTAFDGTRKWLVKFTDGNQVEMVFIPNPNEEDKGTLCISSQVGCTLSCKFCHTGTQTLVRNLETGEIVEQILLAKDFLQDWNQQEKKLTNIVFMGMGEPFYNYENVAKAVRILTDPDGLNFPARKITVSTSGLVPEIKKAALELRTGLAISLHGSNDEQRTKIMAINKRYPISELMEACAFYNQQNRNSKITFEYVMLKDVNDDKKDALALVKLIHKYNLSAKVNLIPFNPWTGSGYECSTAEKINEFQKILKSEDLVATIRKTRGDDVMAACGQLKSESMRVRIKDKGNIANPQ